jgi:hypothetical protein
MNIYVHDKQKPARKPAMISCFMGIKYETHIRDTTKLISNVIPTVSNHLLQKCIIFEFLIEVINEL